MRREIVDKSVKLVYGAGGPVQVREAPVPPADRRRPVLADDVILGEELAELFDGFSIGSNDLTQLALGVDRDSELLAQIFDERDPGVKRLIRMIVDAAHGKKRTVGICGEAPRNYPEFAEFLAGIGIDSISLNLDSLAGVTQRLAAPAAGPPAPVPV